MVLFFYRAITRPIILIISKYCRLEMFKHTYIHGKLKACIRDQAPKSNQRFPLNINYSKTLTPFLKL